MNKKTISMFAMLALFAGVFGVAKLTYAVDTTPQTTTTIANVVPTFTSHTVESWTQAYVGNVTTDARAESSTTYPTNEGTNLIFTATANDTNNDDYYLIVCDAAGVTTGNASAPSCTGTQICVSTSTASDAAATCTKDTTGVAAEKTEWYSYVCDSNSSGLCSAASNTSQGGANDETGGTEAGSPFYVNHVPTFTSASISAVDPGGTLTIYNTSDADSDINSSQDTISFYVCNNATTAFDFKAHTCTGGAFVCNQTGVNPNSANATCDNTADVTIPTANATYTVKIYVEDNHNFAAASQTQTYDVNDVAPIITSYTLDTVAMTAGSSDVVTHVVTFTDDNGDNDPTLVDMVFFDSAATTDACSADENECYRFDNEDLTGPAHCTVSDRSAAGTGKTALGTDNSLSLSCNFTVWYNANAADWKFSATVTDGNGDANFADSNVVTVATLSAINIPEASIAYGNVAVGADSSAQTTTLQNAGNQIIDVLVDGTDMTGGGHTIAAAQQKWNYTTGNFDWSTGTGVVLIGNAASGNDAAGCMNRDLAVRADHSLTTEDEAIAWEIRIPAAQEAGSYTGTNTFETTLSTSCTGTLH